MKTLVLAFWLSTSALASAQTPLPAPASDVAPAAPAEAPPPVAEASVEAPLAPEALESAATPIPENAEPVGAPPAMLGAETTLQALLDRSEADVRARLGEPDVARREDGGALWTYRMPACALYVFFRMAGREGLRVVGASTGPRRRGDIAPGVDACLAVTPQP